jgi:D-glycero-alpha-D-manno-heptose-7-phosphate kinase
MIITRAPLRVSLFGGSTDLPSFYENNNYGAVVSMAIDKYIYIVVHERMDNKIKVMYKDTELVDNLDDIKHDRVRECLRLIGINKGIEIASFHDIPSEEGGLGLGGSSTYTVALLTALHRFMGGFSKDKSIIAEQACEVEINVLKEKIGKQDQYASAFGGLNYIKFEKDKTCVNRINSYLISHLKGLFLLYVGKSRKTQASEILTEVIKNNRITQLTRLRDLADKTYKNFLERDILSFDKMMNESWNIKRSTASSISNQHINEIYNEVIKYGAYSAKLLGAGGGGYMLVHGPNIDQFAKDLASHLNTHYLNFNIDQEGVYILR